MTEVPRADFDQRMAGPVLFTAVVALLALTEVSLIVGGFGRPIWLSLLAVVSGCVYALAGTIAVNRRPNNRTGVILLIGGVAWFLSALSAVEPDLPRTLGLVCLYLPVAAAIHLLMVFPTGGFDRALDRRTVAFVYFASVFFQIPILLFGDNPIPRDLLELEEVPAVSVPSQVLLVASGWFGAAVAAMALRRRYITFGPGAKRALAPFALIGLFAIVAIPLVDNVVSRFVELSDDSVVASQIILLAALPVAVVSAMLRGGFNRIGAIEELRAQLAQSQASRQGLEQTLARTLGDASVRIAFEMAEVGMVDADGSPLRILEEPGRGVCQVDLDGRRVGAITYDRGLIGDSTEVEAAGVAVAIWFERERLVAALGASQNTLSQAQQQIAASANEERKRIAQDLHDGLASRLVLLAVKVQSLGTEGEPSTEVENLRRGIDDALSELRALVTRTMPASLDEFGLVAAIEDLIQGLPGDVRFRISPEFTRPDSDVERTLYFIVAEAVTNSIRHAESTNVEINLDVDPDRILATVEDDGKGGAVAGVGAGIPGMVARAEAAGGTMRIDSRPAEGTRIHITIPRRAVSLIRSDSE